MRKLMLPGSRDVLMLRCRDVVGGSKKLEEERRKMEGLIGVKTSQSRERQKETHEILV